MKYSVGEELIFLLSFTCDYMISVRRGFLLLLVLAIAALFYCGTYCAFHIIIMKLQHLSPAFIVSSSGVSEENLLFEADLSGPPSCLLTYKFLVKKLFCFAPGPIGVKIMQRPGIKTQIQPSKPK